MAKSTSQIITALQKLYDRRAVIDKQIVATEKNLVVGVENAKTAAKTTPAKVGKTVKKAVAKVAVKKPVGGTSRGRKPAKKD